MGARLKLGVQMVPTMPVDELIETVQEAEALGYDYCMVADEGLMHDVYVVLALLAESTSRIQLGPVTNSYTRHPAVTAAALATLDDISDGRAFLTLVAGGTMVLNPLGLSRDHPLDVVRESIEIVRRLWSGASVDFEGRMFSLNEAQLTAGCERNIPIWIAARGPRLLKLAGEVADGVILMAKGDLGDASELVDQGQRAQSPEFSRVYQDRLAYTPDMITEARALYSYTLMDSPDRVLANIGLDQSQIDELAAAMRDGGPSAVTELVTDDMIEGYQVVGSREECRQTLAGLVDAHDLDTFVINIISPGFEANRGLLSDVVEITDFSGGAI